MGLLVPVLLGLALIGLSGAKSEDPAAAWTQRPGASVPSPAPLSSVEHQVARAAAAVGAEQAIRMEQSGTALLIDIEAGALFRSGSAEILPSALPALDAVGAALQRIPNELLVEGHTDSDPTAPGSAFADNWALSSARAAAVLRYLYQFHAIPYRRMSLGAFADSRPVASNSTPAGKARNRRVTIAVRGG